MSQEINSFNDFNELLTAYRKTIILREAVECGIIDCLASSSKKLSQIACDCDLKEEECGRFLNLLAKLNILVFNEHKYDLSDFSKRFLLNDSKESQRAAIEFETKLIDKWLSSSNILRNGQGSLLQNKAQEQYESDLKIYQKAMHNAASVRAKELWKQIAFKNQDGLILDLGCGDGTYLKNFLDIYPGWDAIGCDLSDVVKLNLSENVRLKFEDLNILDQNQRDGFVSQYKCRASIVLLSNFIHCYSENENKFILEAAKELLKENGLLLIHDFYTDINEFGAIYDMHMMLNTYNGRSYSRQGFEQLLNSVGFDNIKTKVLESGSAVMIAKKEVK